ncbi:adenylate/guanylate cyclase domain-containing protein [Ruegeria faecimaris]|uniref:TolB amino-terminal domain-containing protein n=1 Tax=Ruegeria faecimaris TaxID=686389 RepID=A0A521F108_9RHOB|nr:adenylate/guanylate cyclase domain-containing protein [Ruegeria faecimaris]SMO89894.1 TolB amino-terminal domain-containing protein [Ruegeria faecimaris]
MERRLAAIMAADVVGYSRLMGADEIGVLNALKALRSELFDPQVEKHHGRIVKLMGDGTLVEFASVVDAVNCATDIQAELTKRNGDLPPEERLELRIGINLGDVMIDGDDLYGDGVNVAARLEESAEPGGVCVSEVVATQATGKANVGFEYLGETRLKNISEPVRIYHVNPQSRAISHRSWNRSRGVQVALGAALLIVATFVVWQGIHRWGANNAVAFDEATALTRPTGPTIAVLAFENLSGDPSKDYLSDGISEDVIIELGRYRDLNVLSRHTTFSYRGQHLDVRSIGKSLGADFVLEGTVRQAGERLRVTARLIDTDSRAQVWSEAFDEKLTTANLFDVQSRITERVAVAIGDTRGAIRRTDERRARAKPPERLSSYECTMFYDDLYDRPDVQKRVHGCIERVVKEEPDYWRAWAQLAEALRVDLSFFGNRYSGTYEEKLNRALSAANQAKELNPNSARVRLILGILLLMNGDRDGFYAEAEDALAVGGDRSVEAEIGYWLIWTGRFDLGAALLRRAIDLDPGSTIKDWHQALSEHHFHKGEYELALAEARKGVLLDYWWSMIPEVTALAKLGRADELERARNRLEAARPGVKVADIVWVYRRYQRPDALIAPYVDAFRKAGFPEGKYRPLDMNDLG